jgi:hypothetical protein
MGLTTHRFRLAALQLKRLQSKRLLLESDIGLVLSSLPGDINAMYGKILQEDIHENHRPLAIKVLRRLAVSYRPLSIMEISEACTIPSRSELRGATTLKQDHHLTHEQLLNLLPNLVVSIQADPSGEGRGYISLAFAHFSVQEYLMGSQLLESPSANFRIQLRDAHRFVAKECLAYLFISGEMGSSGCLTRYVSEHWQLHAVATGELDEESRRKAFLLSASILSGDLPTDEKKLPEDFVRVIQWLKDPESTMKLMLHMRARYHLGTGSTMRLIILYPPDGDDSMIRCKDHTVLPVYAPPYEAIHCSRTYHADCVAKVSWNDTSLLVTKDTFHLLDYLQEDLKAARLIWINVIRSDRAHDSLNDWVAPTSSEMYKRAERVVVNLVRKPENRKPEKKKRDARFGGWLWRSSPPVLPLDVGLRARLRLEDYLTPLESLLSEESSNMVAGELMCAQDVVFLSNFRLLNLDAIHRSLDGESEFLLGSNPFRGYSSDGLFDGDFVRDRLDGLPNRLNGLPHGLPEHNFPKTRAMVKLLQGKRYHGSNRWGHLFGSLDSIDSE